MKTIKLLGLMFAVLLGIFLVVYGGYDDSPGGQLLGLVVIAVGIVGLLKRYF